jgi:hypothetical protein
MMAHFAELDDNNVVLRVLVVPNEQEHRGEDYLAIDCNLGGRWIQTSFNNQIRGAFAGEGMTYDINLDRFLPKKPYPSWTYDENFICIPPVVEPGDGKQYDWNEENQEWVERPTLEPEATE